MGELFTPADQAAYFVTGKRTSERDRLREYVAEFDAGWQEYTEADGETPVRRDANWRESVRTFARRGVALDDLLVLVDDSMSKRAPWKWLCGACWTKIREAEA